MTTAAGATPSATRSTETERDARSLGAVGDETKPSWKSTELWIYLAAVAGVLIASQAVGERDGQGDIFAADKAWWYITLLTIGYLISRGLAKAGSKTKDPDGSATSRLR